MARVSTSLLVAVTLVVAAASAHPSAQIVSPFEGAACPPAIDTLPVEEDDVYANAVTVRALVYRDCPATVWFEYGAGTNYGNSTQPIVVAPGAEPLLITATLRPLEMMGQYHFRAVASNSDGTATGEDRTFATDSYFYSATTSIDRYYFQGLNFADLTGDDNADLLISSTGPDVLEGFAGETLQDFSYGLSYKAPGWGAGRALVADLDTDGRLDFIANGVVDRAPGPRSLQHNAITDSSHWAFINLPTGGGEGEATGAADYDNDGDLDIFVWGPFVYRNEKGKLYRAASLPAIPDGLHEFTHSYLGDYDNDGDVDLVVVAEGVLQIFRNDDGTFTSAPGPSELPGSEIPRSPRWCDFNDDGNLDITFVTYLNSPYSKLYFYAGDGNGSFTYAFELHNSIRDFAVADFDNDGYSDVLTIGNGVTIWPGRPGAPPLIPPNLPQIALGVYRIAVGEMDGNGTLDLALAFNKNPNTHSVKVFQNLVVPNTPPTAPQNPVASVQCDRIQFSWEPSSDAETPTTALTYNMRVGTTPGGCEIMSPHSDAVTGARRLWQMGNVEFGTDAWLRLKPGTYYWSVQAIDNGYMGSAFSEEQTFSVSSETTLHFTEVARPATNQCLLRFFGCSGNGYVVQKSTNPADPNSWSDLGAATETSPEQFEFIDTAAEGARGFYRLRLQ